MSNYKLKNNHFYYQGHIYILDLNKLQLHFITQTHIFFLAKMAASLISLNFFLITTIVQVWLNWLVSL